MSTNPNQQIEQPTEQPIQPQDEHRGADVHNLPPSKWQSESGMTLEQYANKVAEEFAKGINAAALRHAAEDEQAKKDERAEPAARR